MAAGFLGALSSKLAGSGSLASAPSLMESTPSRSWFPNQLGGTPLSTRNTSSERHPSDLRTTRIRNVRVSAASAARSTSRSSTQPVRSACRVPQRSPPRVLTSQEPKAPSAVRGPLRLQAPGSLLHLNPRRFSRLHSTGDSLIVDTELVQHPDDDRYTGGKPTATKSAPGGRLQVAETGGHDSGAGSNAEAGWRAPKGPDRETQGAEEVASQWGSEGDEEVSMEETLLGLSLDDMEESMRELQRYVTVSLQELDRAAVSMTSVAGLEIAKELRQAIKAEADEVQSRTGRILQGLQDVKQLKEAAEKEGAPEELMERAAERAKELLLDMEEMQSTVQVAQSALGRLMEEGAADLDASSAASLSEMNEGEDEEWLSLLEEKARLKAEVQSLREEKEALEREKEGPSREKPPRVPDGYPGSTTRLDKRTGEEPSLRNVLKGASSERTLWSRVEEGMEVERETAEERAALEREWAELREERGALKQELGELFQVLVRMVREGDREGAEALACANEEAVRGQLEAGEGGVEQAAMLCTLCLFFLGLGDAERGLLLLEQTLGVCAEAEPQPLLDDILENAADVLYGLDRYEEAIPLYLSSLKVQVILAGGDNVAQASTITSLANAYANAGMVQDAIEMQTKAASLVASQRGASSTGVATLLVGLAQLQAAAGQTEAAQDCAERALRIMTVQKGPKAVETAIATCALANAHKAQENDAKAIQLFEEAIGIFKEASDPAKRAEAVAETETAEEAVSGSSSRWLGGVEGEQSWKPAQEEYHPALEKAQEELAQLYQGLESVDDAVRVREDILVAKEAQLGPTNPGIVPALVKLGGSLLECDREAEAEAPLRRAVRLARDSVPEGHAMLVGPIERLCICCLKLGKFSEAERLSRETVAILESAPNPDTSELADSLRTLGFVLHTQEKNEEAEAVLCRALGLAERATGPESAEVQLILSILFGVLGDQGKQSAAARIAGRLQHLLDKEDA